VHRVIGPVKMASLWACRRQLAVAMVSMLAAMFARELRAQARVADDGAWKPPFSLGGAFQVSEPVHEFSSQFCPGYEIVVEGRAGWWVERRKGFLVSVARHSETQGRACDSRRLLTRPDSGIVTYADASPVEGYPYGSASVRMVLAAGPRSHAFLGVQWFWGKRIVAPLVGMGGNYVIGGVTMLFEGQGSVLTVPYNVVTAEFRGGQLVRMARYKGNRKRGHATLRIGIDVPLGIFGAGVARESDDPEVHTAWSWQPKDSRWSGA
jgi:hypothetical protein